MICNKYANTVGTENELRYVIGVIQQYNGVILNRPTERYVGVNTSEYTITRTEELRKLMLLPSGGPSSSRSFTRLK